MSDGLRDVVVYLLVGVCCGAAAGVVASGAPPSIVLQGTVIAICVGVGLVALVDARVGLGLVIAFAPFAYFGLPVMGYSLSSNEIIAATAALAVLPILRLSMLGWPPAAAVAVLAVGSLFSIVPALDKAAATLGFLRWAVVLVLLLAAATVIKDVARAGALAFASLSAAAPVVSGLAALQYFGLRTVVGEPYQADRVDSTFGYYTMYALFTAVVAVTSLSQLVAPHHRLARRLWWVHLTGFVASILGLGLSLSRGGVLGLACGLGVLSLALIRSPHRTAVALLAVSGVAAVALVALPSPVVDDFRARLEGSQNAADSDLIRRQVQQAGVALIGGAPLGLGFGNFDNKLEESVRDTLVFRCPVGRDVRNGTCPHAHRLFVQIALDAGWVGGLGFAVLVLGPVFTALWWGVTARADGMLTASAGGLAVIAGQGWADYQFEFSFLLVLTLLAWCGWAVARPAVRRPVVQLGDDNAGQG